jgi:hypothetical protein
MEKHKDEALDIAQTPGRIHQQADQGFDQITAKDRWKTTANRQWRLENVFLEMLAYFSFNYFRSSCPSY